MITIRKSQERGHFNHGWLDTYHSFSFDQYFDPKHMNFRALRVINEDRVEAGEGFPTHGHKDMEILTYILSGELEHKDSMGNGSVIRRGDIQRMSAGTGVRHSEFNASKTTPVHLLQIWILPEKSGVAPGYEQITLEDSIRKNRLGLIASDKPGKGSVKIRQDVKVFSGLLDQGKTIDYTFEKDRHAWVQVATGAVQVNGQSLQAGDGAALSGESALQIKAKENSEFLLFDLA